MFIIAVTNSSFWHSVRSNSFCCSWRIATLKISPSFHCIHHPMQQPSYIFEMHSVMIKNIQSFFKKQSEDNTKKVESLSLCLAVNLWLFPLPLPHPSLSLCLSLFPVDSTNAQSIHVMLPIKRTLLGQSLLAGASRPMRSRSGSTCSTATRPVTPTE